MNDPTSDDLGDRMKLYERLGAAADQLMPMLPIVARMDGKAFHTFTRGLQRPYDERLSRLMVATTNFLVKLTNACIGYTQSDEITLILYSRNFKSQVFFSGRRDKIVSLLGAYATMYFNRHLGDYLPKKAGRPDESAPVFDARAFNVPTTTEAVNALVWREQDASRNSVSMAAQSMFSHKALHGISCNQMQEMLWQQKGINWNDYPAFFKRGTYIARRRVLRAFTTTELDKLPPKHEARTNPGLMIERQEVHEVDMPIMTTIANRESVVFEGAEPITYASAPPTVAA